MDAEVFAVANQKGGVGKTTTSVNLAASLAAAGHPVLLVDADPQGNATMGSGVDKRAVLHSMYDVLMERRPLADTLVAAPPAAGYDVVPSNGELTAAEVGLVGESGGELRLREALEPARERYRYVIVDCPPALNMLTVNGLCAADAVLVPMQCEYYALEGLAALLDTVERVKERLNPRIRIAGLLRTMFDRRSRLANQVSAQLVRYFGDRVYMTVVPRNVRLAEAPSHGLPALAYDRACKGARAYVALASEIAGQRRAGRLRRPPARPAAMASPPRSRALGRGLDALLGPGPPGGGADRAGAEIPVELIARSPFQPRRRLDPEALDELTRSVRAHGVLQPVVVRPAGADRYELVAGERRWRAAQAAGLETVPAVVREVPDAVALGIAIIENIQREDLTPLEEARGVARLVEEFGMTHREVAEAVGRSRPAVSNLLRLLDLAPDVRDRLEAGELEMGHARALLALAGAAQSGAARTVAERGLSVRQTEALVRRLLRAAEEGGAEGAPGDPDIGRLETRLGDAIGTEVSIRHGKRGAGRLVIRYHSLDELDGILARLDPETASGE